MDYSYVYEALELVKQVRMIIADDDVSGLLNVVEVYADQMEEELNNVLSECQDESEGGE